MGISFSSEKQKARKTRRARKREEIRRVSARFRIRMAIDGIGYYKLRRKSYLSAVKGEGVSRCAKCRVHGVCVSETPSRPPPPTRSGRLNVNVNL
ncbi:Uncharacterized protein DBV15_05167 [Temnothorax longispinosus]|uniref:Uncharacterized protein n=1 Tax=Temnothorax longispinosus TaxID=300112 RepID=A0A4S2KXE2_9HYME|nr:Uncharacterized protein DBV15_05167 [Temnothorax longispinosus]